MQWDRRKHLATRGVTNQRQLLRTISWILTVGEGFWVSERAPSWDACHKALEERKQQWTETWRHWLSCSLSIPWLQLPQTFLPSPAHAADTGDGIRQSRHGAGKEDAQERTLEANPPFLSSFYAWPLAPYVSGSIISAGTVNVFHTAEIQEKQTEVPGIRDSEIRGHNFGEEAPWMPVDATRPPSLEMGFSAASGGRGRPHIPVAKTRQVLIRIYIASLLTSQTPLLWFYVMRGQALLQFGSEKNILVQFQAYKIHWKSF